MSANDVWAVGAVHGPLSVLNAEIQRSVRERKGAVQSPKRVVVTDALPLTGLGKPDKKALRARYGVGS